MHALCLSYSAVLRIQNKIRKWHNIYNTHTHRHTIEKPHLLEFVVEWCARIGSPRLIASFRYHKLIYRFFLIFNVTEHIVKRGGAIKTNKISNSMYICRHQSDTDWIKHNLQFTVCLCLEMCILRERCEIERSIDSV